MGRDSNAYASVAGGSLKLKVDDSGKIKKSKKKKKKKSKNRSRSASPEMGKGLNKIDKEPNYRFAKDIKANVSSQSELQTIWTSIAELLVVFQWLSLTKKLVVPLV